METDQAKRPSPSGLTPSQLRQNQLLRLMSENVQRQLSPSFEVVRMAHGSVLLEAGDAMTYVYFPLAGAVISYVLPMQDCREIETATIGREGVIGGLASVNTHPSFGRAVVRIPGEVARLSLARLDEAMRHHQTLRDLLSRYLDCFIAQTLQSVACSTVHTIEQRYARWLLMMQDRVQSDELPLTQEALAEMFGVARSWVTRVSTSLQDRGLISYHRGVVRIADRPAIEEASCECYRLVRQHFDKVAPALYPGSEP